MVDPVLRALEIGGNKSWCINTIPKIWLNNFVKNLAKNVSKGNLYISLNLLLPRVISFNFLFQSLTRDKSYSMENLAIDSLLR